MNILDPITREPGLIMWWVLEMCILPGAPASSNAKVHIL